VVSRTWRWAGVTQQKRPAAGGAVSPQGAVAEATESAAPRFVGAVAIALPAGLLIQALIDHASYRQPVVPVVVWLGMLAAAAWLMPRARTGELRIGHAAVAIAVAVAAVTAIGLDRRLHGADPTVDWTILGTVWLLALLALTSPAWVWVPGSALVAGIHAVFVLRGVGSGALGLSRLAASMYAVVAILAIFAALRPAVRTHAEMAVRRATLASRSAAERAAAAAIGEVRRGRLSLLEVEALPLLRGIADGTLDPADPVVRRRCAEHAVTLRRALVDRARSGLIAGLEPVLDAARSRGVAVEVQAIGDPGRPAEDVLRATVAAACRVVAELPPQPVTLTAVAPGDSGDETELYLAFERPPAVGVDNVERYVASLGHGLPAEAAWRAALEAEEGGRGCLEVRWRAVPP
jgi:hypothetical protein